MADIADKKPNVNAKVKKAKGGGGGGGGGGEFGFTSLGFSGFYFDFILL